MKGFKNHIRGIIPDLLQEGMLRQQGLIYQDIGRLISIHIARKVFLKC